MKNGFPPFFFVEKFTVSSFTFILKCAIICKYAVLKESRYVKDNKTF